MPIYILKDTTYEIVPQEKTKQDITPEQLMTLANTMSDFFGCFMVFGMSYEGNPCFFASTSSGMEHLALKKFAEDMVLGENDIEFSIIGEEDEDEE
jgi:hypothetical protein